MELLRLKISHKLKKLKEAKAGIKCLLAEQEKLLLQIDRHLESCLLHIVKSYKTAGKLQLTLDTISEDSTDCSLQIGSSVPKLIPEEEEEVK